MFGILEKENKKKREKEKKNPRPMEKMAQGWFFEINSSSNSEGQQQKPSSSLLADWNSYTAAQSPKESSSLRLGFDLESAVKFANDTVSGTFSV